MRKEVRATGYLLCGLPALWNLAAFLCVVLVHLTVTTDWVYHAPPDECAGAVCLMHGL